MLETARLMLRPMRADDGDELLHIFSDPQVMAAFDAQPFERPQMERWVRRNLEHQEQHGYGLFSVILKETGLLIGDCGLEHMEVSATPAAELGYDFRSDHWNQGLATEAASAVRTYAFDTLGLPRLVSVIRVGNEASRRVAEKVRMQMVAEEERGRAAYWVFAVERDKLR